MLFPDWQTLRAMSFCEEIYFSGLSYLEVAARYSHGEGELAMRYAGVFSAKVRTTWIQTKVPSPALRACWSKLSFLRSLNRRAGDRGLDQCLEHFEDKGRDKTKRVVSCCCLIFYMPRFTQGCLKQLSAMHRVKI